jgi:hypothetical protein
VDAVRRRRLRIVLADVVRKRAPRLRTRLRRARCRNGREPGVPPSLKLSARLQDSWFKGHPRVWAGMSTPERCHGPRPTAARRLNGAHGIPDAKPGRGMYHGPCFDFKARARAPSSAVARQVPPRTQNACRGAKYAGGPVSRPVAHPKPSQVSDQAAPRRRQKWKPVYTFATPWWGRSSLIFGSRGWAPTRDDNSIR